VTPVLGVISVILILLLLHEPPRGEAEGAHHLTNTAWCSDIAYIVRNKSFVTTTFGSTAVAFVAGALAWFAPLYMGYAMTMEGHPKPDS
ncbi:PREDICTED: protein spinster-like, partial [Priapulus caudatus]|uniref:Protein spinster-like n=1 Tax=Priapulus caudatus TaxID=37621 RepID=A0ABM1F7Q9_PRICU